MIMTARSQSWLDVATVDFHGLMAQASKVSGSTDNPFRSESLKLQTTSRYSKECGRLINNQV